VGSRERIKKLGKDRLREGGVRGRGKGRLKVVNKECYVRDYPEHGVRELA